jgi:oligosaccharide repeat unit polymerase
MVEAMLLPLISFCALILAHLYPWVGRGRDWPIFSPAKISSFVSAGLCFPHFIVVMIKPDVSEIYNLVGDQINVLLFEFGMLYSLGILTFFIFASAFKPVIHSINHKNSDIQSSFNNYPALIFTSLCYLLSIYLIFEKAGGISNYIENFTIRSDLMIGTGIYYVIKVPAAYISIFLITIQSARTGKPSFFWVLMFVLAMALIESVIGSRRTPMQFLIFAMLVFMITRNEVRIFTFRNVVIGALVAALFIGILAFRDIAANSVNQRSAWSLITNFSYNDMYMFTMHHFSNYEKWHGVVFMDIYYKIFGAPYGLDAPSLDEGLYLFNLFIGRDVSPPMPLSLMYHNSWPMNTFGSGYANFGIAGVLIFFAFQGVLTGYIYKLSTKYKDNAFILFIYLIMVFSFQISNQKIFEMMIILAGLFVLVGPIHLLNTLSAGRRYV